MDYLDILVELYENASLWFLTYKNGDLICNIITGYKTW